MTQTQNELSTYTKETGEILPATLEPTFLREDNNYNYFVDQNGKHFRKLKFHSYSSVVAKTREETIWLADLMDSDTENGIPLRESIGAEFEVADVIMRKYDRVNEETGVIREEQEPEQQELPFED